MIHTNSLAIPADHPAFDGHFPGKPILPGVVLLDAALHLVARQYARACEHPRPGHWQIVTAKFLSAVQPGEPLTLEHEALPNGTVRFAIRTTSAAAARPVATGLLKPLSGDGHADGPAR